MSSKKKVLYWVVTPKEKLINAYDNYMIAKGKAYTYSINKQKIYLKPRIRITLDRVSSLDKWPQMTQELWCPNIDMAIDWCNMIENDYIKSQSTDGCDYSIRKRRKTND